MQTLGDRMLINDGGKVPRASEYENGPEGAKKEGSIKGTKIAGEGPKWKAQGKGACNKRPTPHPAHFTRSHGFIELER